VTQEALVSAIQEPKAKEMGGANLRTMLLDPDMGADLAAQLLVYAAGISGFGELVGGTAHLEFGRRGIAAGLDLDQDTHVEAAADPVLGWQDDARVSSAQCQVMHDEAGDGVSLLPEILTERLDRRSVRGQVEDVSFLIESGRKGHGAPIRNVYRRRHGDGRLSPKRELETPDVRHKDGGPLR